MLSSYLRKRVSVVTVDGRNLVGLLHAADQLMNIVLTSCMERIAAPYDDLQRGHVDNSGEVEPVEIVNLGVMMLRGADVVSIAAIDVYEEAGTNVAQWAGRDMPPVTAG